MDEEHPDYRTQEAARIELLTNDSLFEELLESRCGDKKEGYSTEFCQWHFNVLYQTLCKRLRRVAFLPTKGPNADR